MIPVIVVSRDICSTILNASQVVLLGHIPTTSMQSASLVQLSAKHAQAMTPQRTALHANSSITTLTTDAMLHVRMGIGMTRLTTLAKVSLQSSLLDCNY